MIDVNVYLGQWPFRRLPYDGAAKLAAKLRGQGVTQAWAGSFEAVLQRDIGGVNARLAAECKEFGEGMFQPFGAINPNLPDWREDVRRCQEDYGMPGIRLHPNYHGYELDAPQFAELLDMAHQHKLIVQIAVKMEDARTQHPLLRMPPTSLAPLPKLLEARAGLRVVILNGLRNWRAPVVEQLASLGERVAFEIATLEGVGGVEKLIAHLGVEHVLFGSYSPFFYLESAVLKLKESELGGVQRNAILKKNAARLLAT